MGINPFEAARRAGFERSYINDLLIGKKQGISRKRLPALATALECDERYLAGMQDAPVAANAAPPGRITLKGYVEAGAWRAAMDGGERPISISPLPTYPAEAQVAYIVRGDHAAGIDAPDGTVVIAVSGMPAREGDVVIARRTRGAEQETSVRIIRGNALIAAPRAGDIAPLKREDAEVVAVVVAAMKLFAPIT